MKKSLVCKGQTHALGLVVTASIAAVCQAWAVPVYNPATGHWYDIVSSGPDGSWAQAEANAVALGGHLVTINDAAEEAWLRATFGTERFWIGFNDAAVEGVWIWSSGEPVSYTHWDTGEPNNCMPPAEGEDYGVLNWDYATGAWNDWSHKRPGYYHIDGIAEWRARVPEAGSTLALFGLSCLALGIFRWRCG